MNIEKLGIKPIPKGYNAKYIDDPVITVFRKDIEELEQQRNEMLEALIKAARFYEDILTEGEGLRPYQEKEFSNIRMVIEKITGKTWPNIKDLL